MAEDTVVETTGVKKAVELYKEGNKRKILIVLWDDERVGICVRTDEVIHCCYNSAEPSPELYYIAQAFYTEPGEKFGYRVKELHRE